MDIDVLAKYSRFFGYGRKTGVSLPRETTGLIPTKDWKLKRNGTEWQLGDTLSCLIGQSYILTTPIQLALSYATIANRGTLYHPYLIKEVFSNTGEILERGKPEVTSKITISKKTFDLINKALFQVVNVPGGTAFGYRGKGIQMAGKTGTSQVVRISADKIYSKCEEREYKLRHHALFTAYAPADDPKVAVAVIVEHGCAGSSAAAPVARDMVQVYMDKYYPDLSKQIMADDKKRLGAFYSPADVKKPAEAVQPTELPTLSDEEIE